MIQKTKTAWMSEVEGMVIEEILNRAEGNEIEFEGYDYDLDAEKTLLVPDRYADLYRNYLYAKVDYANAEYERYNNSVTMFERLTVHLPSITAEPICQNSQQCCRQLRRKPMRLPYMNYAGRATQEQIAQFQG